MGMEAKKEWDRPDTIIVARPGAEIFYGALYPVGALYQGPYSPAEARAEHDAFREALSLRSGRVLDVWEVLLSGTGNGNGSSDGEDLERLKGLARESMSNIDSLLNLNDKTLGRRSIEYTLDMLGPADLIDIIRLQPSFSVGYTGTNNNFDMRMRVKPVYNIMFSRDQQITTDKGVVMGNMNSDQRMSEVCIMEMVYRKLGIEPLHAIANGKLEGGDFIPAGEVAFIGQGLRTNAAAIKELLGNGLLGYGHVAVVKDTMKGQDEMHLDTYFNIAGPTTAVALADRVNGGFKEPLVDLYTRNASGSYELPSKDRDIPFTKVLKDFGFSNIIGLSKEMQLAYGINFLTVAPDTVIGVDIAAKQDLQGIMERLEDRHGASYPDFYTRGTDFKAIGDRYMDLMRDIDYTPVRMNMLNMLYGGPHCSVQASRSGR